MKTRSTGLVGLILIFLCGAPINGDEPVHPPLGGDRDDAHGNIKWESALSDQEQNWLYLFEVHNRDKDKNCHVVWDILEIDSLIPPGRRASGRHELNATPRDVEGILRYNGGAVAGPAAVSARAYVPEDGKPTKTDSELRLAIPVGEIVYPVLINADSKCVLDVGSEIYKVSYVFALSPDKPAREESPRPGTSYDLGSLLMEVHVEWSSIASPDWKTLEPSAFGEGSIEDGRYLRLAAPAKADEPHQFKATLSLKKNEIPIVSNGVIRFLRKRSEKEDVLARAWLPAYARDSKERRK